MALREQRAVLVARARGARPLAARRRRRPVCPVEPAAGAHHTRIDVAPRLLRLGGIPPAAELPAAFHGPRRQRLPARGPRRARAIDRGETDLLVLPAEQWIVHSEFHLPQSRRLLLRPHGGSCRRPGVVALRAGPARR